MDRLGNALPEQPFAPRIVAVSLMLGSLLDYEPRSESGLIHRLKQE